MPNTEDYDEPKTAAAPGSALLDACEHAEEWLRMFRDESEYDHGGLDEALETLQAAISGAEKDPATEVDRLRSLIAAHVNASNNDDTAGDTFAALMQEVRTV